MEKEKRTEKSYAALLNYFDSRYGGDTERTNYAHVLNSMKEEHTVSALVKTYNKVLHKILIIYYRSEDNFPSYWVEFMTNDQQWLWEDLKAFLNDQIRRIFDETPYSDQLALECITNLREEHNYGAVRKYIASKSSEEVNAVLEQVMACKKTVHDAPKHMSQFNLDTNDYREYKPKYIDDIKFLIKNGYHKGYNDVYFEMQTKITYMPDTKSWVYFISACIVLIPLVALLMHYAFIGIFFIICILALLKMIK